VALTGNTVQSTYLDLVQLEKSGAGLPSHAGKEAALYDGSGAQIVGRSAVRHWLDPHPDAAAFAETWEFSTKGTMTQGQLETAGWTFYNCTATVANGLLVLTSTGGVTKASIDVSFSGDFDIVITPYSSLDYLSGVTTTNYYFCGGGGVADYRAGTADVAHYGLAYTNAGGLNVFDRLVTGAFTTLGGTSEADNAYGGNNVVRVYRKSAANEIACAAVGLATNFRLIADDSAPNASGFVQNAAVNDSSTYNKLFLTWYTGSLNAGEKSCFASIRRFQ